MHLTPETIEEYFSRYEWSYTRSSENTWITGVRTSVSSFRIFIRLSEHWIYFVINPFVVAPPNAEDRLRFYYHVLRLNLDMNMAKFGLDSDGDLFLAVELPTENFGYSHFADALNGVSHHAERLYSEVFNLAHNATLLHGRYDDELRGDDLPKRELPPPSRPLDDMDLPEDLNDSSEIGPIIAGKEVRIVDGEDGNPRIEFETAHDLDAPEDLFTDTPSEADSGLALLDDAGESSVDAPRNEGNQRDGDEPESPHADSTEKLDDKDEEEDD
ncbi:MAG: YbjN domain-containing protein [Anaerolineae bacterium]|nr:YbjN domain-containing protein [Anaerolineae bacterium]